MKIVCVSFLKIVSTLLNPVPDKIEDLLRNRIETQYRMSVPSRELHFDDPNCENKGTYTYTSTSILLNAENKLWSGTLELDFNSLLDGRKISFEKVSPVRRLFTSEGLTERSSNRDGFFESTAVRSTLAAVLIAGVVGWIVQSARSRQSPPADRGGASKVSIGQQSKF
jgi:hypothetical protein